MAERIRVLLVDDERELAELGAELLETADPALGVTTAAGVDAGLSALDESSFDCVVSDYDMPGRDGLAFLEAVRERHGDLPFVVFTAKGSEEVASDALSAGATDYLQKEPGGDQYELLANRVTNAVEQRRARRRIRETRHQLESLARNTNDILWMFSADWSELRFVNDAYESIWGRPVEQVRADPTSFLEGIHPEDRDRVRDAMARLTDGEAVDLEYRVNDAEDYGRWVWVQGQPVFDATGDVEAVAGFARDVTARREREAALEAANERLRALQRQLELTLETTDTYAWRWDIAADVVERTPSMAAVFDVDEEPTSVLEDVLARVHPDDRTALEAALEGLRDDGEPYQRRYRLETADGWVWVEERGDRLDATTAVGLVTDVTERFERERALAHERDRLSTLFENFPEPAIEYEFVEDEPVVRSVNEAFVETFRYDRKEAVGGRLNELVVPPDRLAEAAALDEGIRAGERLDAEVRRRTGAGVRDFRIRNIPTPSANADGFAIYSDVTERVDRERRLKQLRERIQDLLYARSREDAAAVAAEAAHDVIGAPLTGFHLLDDEGAVLEPVGMIESVESADYEPPTYRRDADEGTRSAVVWDVYEAGGTLRIDDTEAYGPLGEPALNRSVIISTIAGHGVCILASPEVGAFDDTQESLTEILASFVRTAFDRLERDEALRERERQLAHQNERLEEFAGVISHDLRNPLNVLAGSLEQAEETGKEAAFARAHRAVERMDELIEDMLTLARAGRTNPSVEPVELPVALEEAWETVDSGNAELRNRATVRLAADPSRLRQLLENLLGNAVEHAGDTVTVTVGDLEDGFFIEDDGPGVQPAVSDKVFDSGFTTVPEGTGFGLAIVEQIASAHGWSVDLHAGDAGGARIEVRGVDASG